MNQMLVDQLGNTLTSDGWQSAIRPNLEALRDGAIKALCLPGNVKATSDGKVTMTDDYLKGKIDTLNWMLMWDSRLQQLAAEIEAVRDAEQEQETALGTPYAPQAGDELQPAVEGA